MIIRPINFFLRGFNPSNPNQKRIEDLLRGDKDMRGADLSGADLSKKRLWGIDFRGANLERANLLEANLMNCNLEGANLFGANLEWVNFNKANLRFANLYGSKIRYANFEEADLSYANLSKNLFGYGINFRKANLEGITWISGRVGEDSSLVRANITNANLEALRIGEAYCFGADFSNSNLKKASFRETDFKLAKFKDSYCESLYFGDSDMRGADFEGANLSGAIFNDVLLSDYVNEEYEGITNFEGRRVSGSQFRNCSGLSESFIDDLVRRGATFRGLR